MDDLLSAVVLNRQRGLATELDSIANNLANASTTGFRREGSLFVEHIVAAAGEGGASMGDLSARFISDRPGEFRETGRTLDIAIEGDGYFTIERDGEILLTRAGAFQVSPDGTLVTSSGDPVLDTAGSPIFIPPDAVDIRIGHDGTIAARNGPLAQIAVVTAVGHDLTRSGSAALRSTGGFEALETARLRQGALEGSNVDPIMEIARMIEVSRAYERAQAMMEDQDDRVRNVLETVGRAV